MREDVMLSSPELIRAPGVNSSRSTAKRWSMQRAPANPAPARWTASGPLWWKSWKPGLPWGCRGLRAPADPLRHRAPQIGGGCCV